MYAKSLWVNQENIGRNVNLTIGKGNIYVNGEHIDKDSNICVFTGLKELKEIEYVDVIYTEINNITLRACAYVLIDDGFISCIDKEDNVVAYIKMSNVKELTLRTSDYIMFIADEQ